MSILIRRLSMLAFICLSGLCVACGTAGLLDETAKINSDQDAYFVIGAQTHSFPAGEWMPTWVMVLTSSVKDGIAVPNPWFGTDMVPYLNPTDEGYVVGKALHAGDTLDVNEAGPAILEGYYGRTVFTPCGVSKTMVFNAPGGKVVYIGDIDVRYDTGDKSLRYRYSSNLEKARVFLRRKYPQLADKLEMGSYKLLPCEHKPD